MSSRSSSGSSGEGARPRLLVLGHTYSDLWNHAKIRRLGQDFEVEVGTCRHEDAGSFAEDASDRDARAVYPIHRLRAIGGRYTRQWYCGLAGLLRRGDFDLVLCEAEPWSVLRWQTALILGTLPEPSARLVEFSWETLPRSGLRKRFLDIVYRFASRSCDLLVTGNQIARGLALSRGYKREQLRVLPQLGVDSQHFRIPTAVEKRTGRRAHGVGADEVVIGFCGRLVESKGVDTLLEAFLGLVSEGKKVRLLLMGPGELPPSFAEALSGGAVIQLPPCSHREVRDFLWLLDLLVLPSRRAYRGEEAVWEEQFGRVLIEAMSCGVVAVGSDSGAIPEVLGSENTVFPEGDAPSLQRLLSEIVSSRDIWKKLRKEQASRVKNFTDDEVGRAWSETLTRVLDGGS